jgi:Ca2+-binding RTX toxin-like protein
MGRILLAAPFAVLLVLAGVSAAGSYTPPPGDCCPQWSPHGTQIVFTANRGQGDVVGVVGSAGGPEHLVPGIPVGVRSPDWTYVAYRRNSRTLVVSRVDGTNEHVVGETFGDADWAPDSTRLTFGGTDGSIRVVRANGSGAKTIASPPAGSPDWSPDGRRIAYTRGTAKPDVHIVNPDGSDDVNLTPASARGNVHPVWSPDGTRVAYWSSDGTVALLAVTRIGGTTRTFLVRGAVTNGALVWSPDGKTIYGAGTVGLVGFDPTTGKRHTLVGIPGGVFSPDGKHIAFAAGGECRDRIGVYVANANGKDIRRVSNSCRIVGTSGADVIHADFSRVVLGLGGNDTLYADDTYYFFDGNTLFGGPGNDRLVGGFGRDTLNGGPGADTITGGGSIDTIVGGPGRDSIQAGGGGDVIRARDGDRDVVACGANGFGRGGRDTVFADRIDSVASDCEIVRRS